MIRQAISCDICGAEKRQTNHWFMAYTHGGELRVMAWEAGGRVRSGCKHLCGQTCVHKLLDDFIAGTMASRKPPASDAVAQREHASSAVDATVTKAACGTDGIDLLTTATAARSLRVLPAVIAISPARAAEEARAAEDSPASGTGPNSGKPANSGLRHRRAEAWERERERERNSGLTTHRKIM